MKRNFSFVRLLSSVVFRRVVISILAVALLAFIGNLLISRVAYEYLWMWLVIKHDFFGHPKEYIIDDFESFKISYFRKIDGRSYDYELGIYPYLTPELEEAIRDWGYPFDYEKIRYVAVDSVVNQYSDENPLGIG